MKEHRWRYDVEFCVPFSGDRIQKEMPMDLKAYFENASGFGVMATADGEGRTNAAIYSRPHVFDDGTWAFIMRDRLTHHNLQSNHILR